MEEIKKIIQFIENDDLVNALETLKEVVGDNTEVRTQISVLMGRLARWEKANREGLGPKDTDRNKIVQDLTFYLKEGYEKKQKKSIAKHVPKSPILILLILCLALLGNSFISTNNTKEEHSISEVIDKSNDYLPQIKSLIKESTDEVWFMAISFHISGMDFRTVVLDALDRGVNVRYLQINPDNDSLIQQIANYSRQA